MKKCLPIVLMFGFITVYGQQDKFNLIGIRPGITKISYYDETINYKVYNNVKLDPLQLRYKWVVKKNTFLINIYYLKSALTPTISEVLVLNDEVTIQMGAIDFTYLRRIVGFNDKINFKIGINLSSRGFLGKREFTKTYSGAGIKFQDTYEVSFISLSASAEIAYQIDESLEFVLLFSSPFLSLNPSYDNTRVSPFKQDLMLMSYSKYSGLNSEVAINKKVNRILLEGFISINFYNYKTPNTKKLLSAKIGVGLYYEL